MVIKLCHMRTMPHCANDGGYDMEPLRKKSGRVGKGLIGT